MGTERQVPRERPQPREVLTPFAKVVLNIVDDTERVNVIVRAILREKPDLTGLKGVSELAEIQRAAYSNLFGVREYLEKLQKEHPDDDIQVKTSWLAGGTTSVDAPATLIKELAKATVDWVEEIDIPHNDQESS